MTADRSASCPVATKYIFAVLAVVFFTMAATRARRDAPDIGRQARTWFVISGAFVAVSAWLFITE